MGNLTGLLDRIKGKLVLWSHYIAGVASQLATSSPRMIAIRLAANHGQIVNLRLEPTWLSNCAPNETPLWWGKAWMMMMVKMMLT